MNTVFIIAHMEKKIRIFHIPIIKGILLLFSFFLITSCDQITNKNLDWRSVNTDTLLINDALWLDFYNESAAGPLFWQLEFLDSTVIEYKSMGFNILQQTEIPFDVNKDTLILFYPVDYVFDNTIKMGEFMRIRTEKWLMKERTDTLILQLISKKSVYYAKEVFPDHTVMYQFIKPLNKLEFPDNLIHAPINKQEIINILNNLYSKEGKAKLMQHFNNIPENEEDYQNFRIRTSIIFSDLIKVFDIDNSPTLQEMFDHYHPEVIAGSIIGIYLDYLESTKNATVNED